LIFFIIKIFTTLLIISIFTPQGTILIEFFQLTQDECDTGIISVRLVNIIYSIGEMVKRRYAERERGKRGGGRKEEWES